MKTLNEGQTEFIYKILEQALLSEQIILYFSTVFITLSTTIFVLLHMIPLTL